MNVDGDWIVAGNTTSIVFTSVNNATNSNELVSLGQLTNNLANTSSSLNNEINTLSSNLQSQINNVVTLNSSLTNLVYNTSNTLQSEINNNSSSLTNLVYNTSNTLQSELNDLNSNLTNDYYTIPQINTTFFPISGGNINGSVSITDGVYGEIKTPSQTNITSLGTITELKSVNFITETAYSDNYLNMPYSISFYVSGTIPLIMYQFISPFNVSVPDNSYFGIAGTGATDNTTYNMVINSISEPEAGNIVFLANSNTATFNSTGFSISSGQTLTIINNSTIADATLSNISITLVGSIA